MMDLETQPEKHDLKENISLASNNLLKLEIHQSSKPDTQLLVELY